MIENEIESNKKGACLQDSPPGLGRFSDIYLSAASGSCPVGFFYAIGDSNRISYCAKSPPADHVGFYTVRQRAPSHPIFQFYFPALITFISCVTFFRFVMPLYIKRHTQ